MSERSQDRPLTAGEKDAQWRAKREERTQELERQSDELARELGYEDRWDMKAKEDEIARREGYEDAADKEARQRPPYDYGSTRPNM